jgi:hypothetical protein
MTRIFKYYNFPLDGSGVMAPTIAMSSYPGVISSMDDYYMLSSGLIVMDTSIEILNSEVYDDMKSFNEASPHIPNFIHIMIANRLAKNANQWTRIQGTMNTGTYNSQWMIVDYNQFTPGKPAPDNLLWVVDSVPGIVHAEDLSHRLRTEGYFASYNRPYFTDVRDRTGHTAAMKSHGALYSWDDNPRARIFRAAAGTDNLMSMRALMQHNLFPITHIAREPSHVEPGHEIAARNDLSPREPIPNGGIDSKVTAKCLFDVMMANVISGPAHDAVPAFKWSTFPNFPHVGLPEEWSFGWVMQGPLGQGGLGVDCA